MNLTRQPLSVALISMVIFAIGALIRKSLIDFSPELIQVEGAIIPEFLRHLQQAWPKTAWVVSFVLLCSSSIALSKVGTNYQLYPGVSLTVMPLYIILACGVFIPSDLLLGCWGSLLLVRTIRNFCSSYRNGYAFTQVFRASLYLGMLPLFLPASALLVLLLPIGIVLFKRTVREVVVAIVGLLLPVGFNCYISWVCGYSFWDPFQKLYTALFQTDHLNLFDGATVPFLIFVPVVLAMTLWASFIFLGDRYSAGSKARSILSFMVWTLILSIGTIFMPGSTSHLFMVVAAPSALIIPYLFANLGQRVSNYLYLLLVLLFVVRQIWV